MAPVMTLFNRKAVNEAEAAEIQKRLAAAIEALDNCMQHDLANNVRDVSKEVARRTYQTEEVT
jgi:hypothetical protein